MIHVRYPRAAIAVGTGGKPAQTTPRNLDQQAATAPLVLWASTALPVRVGGRLVGLRRNKNSEVEVAWVAPGSPGIQWVLASLVLMDQEARHWRKIARFYRQ